MAELAEIGATLLSYRLHDLLMFSAATYFGLFELVNRRTWPAPLVSVLIVLAMLVVAARVPASQAAARMSMRVTTLVVALGMAAASTAVALIYFRGGFAAIHWLGPAWIAAFLMHAVLCLALAFRLVWPTANPIRPWAGGLQHKLGLAMLLGAAAWPALAPATQRSLWQVEVVGLAPDATVLLLLGGLLLLRLPRLWSVAGLVVPLAWCLFSGATLWALQQPQALVLPLAGAVALLWVLVGGRLGR